MLNQTLLEWQPSWAEGSAAQTKHMTDVGLPSTGASGTSIIVVENPSLDTAIVVQPQIKTRFGNRLLFADYGSPLTIAAGATAAFMVNAWPVDQGGRLVVWNVSELPTNNGFTASVKVIAL